MRRSVSRAVIVFGLNVVVLVCSGLSAVLWVVRDDPLSASLPALLAFVGLVLQPWGLLFLPLPIAMPFLTTAITLVAYPALDRRGYFYGVRRRWGVPSRRTMWRAALAIGGLSFAFAYVRYRDWPPLNVGHPSSLDHIVQAQHLETESRKRYFLGGFIDTEHVWRADIGAEDLERLLAYVGDPPPVDEAVVPRGFFRQPPYWWNPRGAASRSFYRSPSFRADGRGPDGSHYLLMYDREERTLYAWIKDNF